jgi:hypothetical protein
MKRGVDQAEVVCAEALIKVKNYKSLQRIPHASCRPPSTENKSPQESALAAAGQTNAVKGCRVHRLTRPVESSHGAQGKAQGRACTPRLRGRPGAPSWTSLAAALTVADAW